MSKIFHSFVCALLLSTVHILIFESIPTREKN